MLVTFQEVVGGVRKLLVCAGYAYMHVRSRLCAQIQCAKIFTVQNDLQKNFRRRHALAKLAKIFSW